MFRTDFGKTIFETKYRNAMGGCATWEELCDTLVQRVCRGKMSPGDMTQLASYMRDMKFIPAGRYLYYAGREAKFFNNCFSFIAEDSREGWAELGHKHFMALMVGGGCGSFYGDIRPEGETISRTGGYASGPLPLMYAMNEIGRNVQQGGSRRSALYASLPWDHADIDQFLFSKDWSEEVKDLKAKDFNFPAPLDMTNISVQYDSINGINSSIFEANVRQAMKTGEPGFQFDLYTPEEVGRNACAEFITEHDSDLCNLGSINMSRIDSLAEMHDVAYLGSQFLVCGSLMSELPFGRCYDVRNEHRKIGLGLMGVHEFLLENGFRYEMNWLLEKMLENYELGSEAGADYLTKYLGVSDCERYRSVAPAGTISILAGTTSGIEPLYSVATKRRYLEGKTWKYEYTIDPLAEQLIKDGAPEDSIETAIDLSKDIERRVKFQADVQEYVDMGISSTLNLPPWGSDNNNHETVDDSIQIFRKYAPMLRGLTCYPDGSRGGQPLTVVPYTEAKGQTGKSFEEELEFLTTVSCPSGACGI